MVTSAASLSSTQVMVISPKKSVSEVVLVRSYLRDIGRVPLLTNQQEMTLGRQVQDLMALEKLENELKANKGEEITPEEFANASIEDIYGDEIIDAYERKVTSFESIVLINRGNNKFDVQKLPPLAQSIPILTSDVYDINNDGYEDIIVAGNIYNTEVETPRLDNQFALVLISDKNRNYNVSGPDKSGLYLSGNTKSIKIIGDESPKLLVANNNSDLEVFELNK